MFVIKSGLSIISVAKKSNFTLFAELEINIGKLMYFDWNKKIDHEILSRAASKITNQIKLSLGE